MYFLKVTYDISCGKFTIIPADGEHHGITQGLSALARDNGDRTFTLEMLTWERNNPQNTALEKKEIRTLHTVKAGKQCLGQYSQSEWSYMKGIYYRHPSYEAKVIDGKTALKESDDPVIKAQVYVEMGKYRHADKLLTPILPPDPKHYYFVNKNAHKLQAMRYELGLGVKKDLGKAYIHYLYAEAYDDIVRFMDMGYGKGVLSEHHRSLDWNEYYPLRLLHAAGERAYAEYRINWNANCWTYDRNEKEATKRTNAKWYKANALCRRQVCEWMMANAKNADIDRFTLMLGAYLAYLSEGHEGSCSGIREDPETGSKSNTTSLWWAEKYIASAVAAGNSFAIQGKGFIDKVRGRR